ncbi:MAG: hypothetical protein ACRDIY_08440 [Chloroflexota bacterium]
MNVIQLRMEALVAGVPADPHAAIDNGAMPGMARQAGSGFLAGVAPDHAAALLAPLFLPLAIWMFLSIVELAAKADLPGARRCQRGLEAASPLTRTTAFLLALAGAIHVALVPGHLGEDGSLAVLFALNGITFVGVGIAAFVWRRWRPVAAVLLAATLAAYLYYLGSGREDLDLVGTVTYLVELVTLGLVWIPRGPGLDLEPESADQTDRGRVESAA